jgi:hypothetical protein
MYIDPVDVSDSKTRELIVECERALEGIKQIV